ncbi:acyltransferase family protein [Terriglobus aquaticus]|uniref:Acyltransferase family protein n=1 Tax=Terriglobus aquaticus TaxID=940139 RepID=A0ABW9KEX6_9BACT|nr:heparan-alpha-glucosaminide N-acetyltransferase domain-containing protein [Terriglobus aquaticus]
MQQSAADPLFSSVTDADVVARPTAVKPARLLSIDVLRGLTIAFMIVVNDQMGPAPFHQLSHAKWNGLTATDLVFPTFLFLVGLTTVLSTASRLARNASRREMFVHVVRRALLLILLGFVVNNFPFTHLANARYYGVLPRIGLCYFVAASVLLVSRSWKDKLAIAVVCLLGYWVLMRFVPVPGYGVPTHDVPINDFDGNLTAWLDRQIFSARHLYEKTRDPEGLLSTIPAIATTMFGMLAGMWVRSTATTGRKAAGLLGAGSLLIVLGAVWNVWFPVNKKLWTSSYTLVAAGISTVLLALAIQVIDRWRLGRKGNQGAEPSGDHASAYWPVLVLGTNAILAYLISELGATLLHVFHTGSGRPVGAVIGMAFFRWFSSPAIASLMYSLAFLLVCWLLTYPFYRKRIFLRI